MAVDLHLHSTASDGTLTPSETIEKAAQIGLSAIALTDHDSFAGIEEARAKSQALAVDFITGVELSSERKGRAVHMLGYFLDWRDEQLNRNLADLRLARLERGKRIIDKLAALGIGITFAEVEEAAKGGSVGRPHIAHVLVKHGACADVGEAFDRYLASGRPAYEPKYILSVDRIIDLVHAAGGVVSVAHPGVSEIDESVLQELRRAGVDGVEVWHADHTPAEVAYYAGAAKRLGLLATGGSDCHGYGKRRGFVLGSLDIPDAIIKPLEQRAQAIRSR